MFLGLPDRDPDPLVRGMDPDPSIIMKNDVNVPVPSKSNKQKKFVKKLIFCLHLEGQ